MAPPSYPRADPEQMSAADPTGAPRADLAMDWMLHRPTLTPLQGPAELVLDTARCPRLRWHAGSWRTMRLTAARGPQVRTAQAVGPALADVVPDPATARLLTQSVPTVAGRFFLDPPVDVRALPAVPDSMFAIHIVLDRGGFRIGGRLIPPRILARVISHCPEWRRRPVLVLTVGAQASHAAGSSLMASLTAALDVPVLSADNLIYLAPRTLITAGTFRCWNPPSHRSAGAQATVALGRQLPAIFAPASRRPAPASASTGPESRLADRMMDDDSQTVNGANPTGPVLDQPEPSVPEPAEPEPGWEPVSAPIRTSSRRAGVPGTALGRDYASDLDSPPAAQPFPLPSIPEPANDVPAAASPVDEAPPITEPVKAKQANAGEPANPALAPAVPAVDTPTPIATPAIIPAPVAVGVAAVKTDLLRPMPPVRMPSNRARPRLPLPPTPLPSSTPSSSSIGSHPTPQPHLPSGSSPADKTSLNKPPRAGTPPASAAGTSPVAARPVPASVGFEAPVQLSRATSPTEPVGEAGVAVQVAPVQPVAPVEPVGPAPWVQVEPSAIREDRERLRALLGWEYESHARAVDGVLALLPGLRASAGAEDLLAGLVAVRAQLSPLGAEVDGLLRGEPDPPPDDEPVRKPLTESGVELLARCAASGLRRLPVVVGPVFRPGIVGPAALARYRSGARLIEPAFTEARLGRTMPAGTTVEYAIWSFTGRRTDRLAQPGAPGASPRVLFGAGAHFVVLGVEELAEPGAPVRVLLQEVPAASPTGAVPGGRAKERLQESVQAPIVPATESEGALPAQWRHPLGIRDDATPFASAGAA